MSATKPLKTKRNGFRFPGHKRPLPYKSGSESGEAQLVNISTGGCAIENATTELIVDDRISLSIPLDDQEEPIEIEAQVLRASEGCSGMKFLDIEENLRLRIVRFFALENRRQQSSD